MHERHIDIGYQCLRNEERNVRGWAKQMLYFCKKVYAHIDPDTTDKTVEILQTEFPQINILYQDKDLGDSDYDHEGPTKALSMHLNATQFMNSVAKENDWIMFMAGDERFHPDDIDEINGYVEDAIKKNLEGVVFTTMYEFIDDLHYVDFSLITSITQVKFFRKPKLWIINPQPHSNRNWHPLKCHKLSYGMYHYPNHRGDGKVYNCWVYQGKYSSYDKLQKRYGFIPVKTCPKLIEGWREMPRLTNKGDLID